MCEFVFHPEIWPDDPKSIDEKWECPYPSLSGVDYCIFHVTPLTRNSLLPTERAKLIALREAILSERQLHIICSTWFSFNLDFAVEFLPQNVEIQIGCSSFWDFNAQEATIPNDVRITECWFNNFDTIEAEFQRDFDAESSHFEQFVVNMATFDGHSFLKIVGLYKVNS